MWLCAHGYGGPAGCANNAWVTCVYVVIASAYGVIESACTIINYGYGVFVIYAWETGTTMLGHLGYRLIAMG